MLLSIYYDEGTITLLACRDDRPPLFSSLSLGLESPPSFNGDLLDFCRSDYCLRGMFSAGKEVLSWAKAPTIVVSNDITQIEKGLGVKTLSLEDSLHNLDFPFLWFGLGGIYSPFSKYPISCWEDFYDAHQEVINSWGLAEYGGNRFLFPSYTPLGKESLNLEESFQWLLVHLWRNGAEEVTWPDVVESIVFGGRFLSLPISLEDRLLPVLEAAPPDRFVEYFFDTNNLLPALGALAVTDPALYQQALRDLPFLRAASVFHSPGETLVEFDFGWGEISRASFPREDLAVLPLSSRDSAFLATRLANGRILPPLEVHGGESGLIFDTRTKDTLPSSSEEILNWRHKLSLRKEF